MNTFLQHKVASNCNILNSFSFCGLKFLCEFHSKTVWKFMGIPASSWPSAARFLIDQSSIFPVSLYLVKIQHETGYPPAQTILLPKWKRFIFGGRIPIGLIYIKCYSAWCLKKVIRAKDPALTLGSSNFNSKNLVFQVSPQKKIRRCLSRTCSEGGERKRKSMLTWPTPSLRSWSTSSGHKTGLRGLSGVARPNLLLSQFLRV